jgi:hypothetical protein
MSPRLPLLRPSLKTLTAATEHGTVSAATAPRAGLPSNVPTVDQVEAALAVLLKPTVMEIYHAVTDKNASISIGLVMMEASVRTGLATST